MEMQWASSRECDTEKHMKLMKLTLPTRPHAILKNIVEKERENVWTRQWKAPTGMHFCINRACRVQIGWWGWRWRWLLLWFRGRGRLFHADRVDPEGFCFPITFLTGDALLVSLEHVLTAAAVQTVPLQQFVHSLDYTLQTFVNIPPHLFL